MLCVFVWTSSFFFLKYIATRIPAVLNIVTAALYATVVKDEIGFELKHLYIGWGLVFLSVALLLVGGLLALILARMVGGKKVGDSGEGKDRDK